MDSEVNKIRNCNARACLQLSRMIAEASSIPARKISGKLVVVHGDGAGESLELVEEGSTKIQFAMEREIAN